MHDRYSQIQSRSGLVQSRSRTTARYNVTELCVHLAALSSVPVFSTINDIQVNGEERSVVVACSNVFSWKPRGRLEEGWRNKWFE